jgi:hypothetical protein
MKNKGLSAHVLRKRGMKCYVMCWLKMGMVKLLFMWIQHHQPSSSLINYIETNQLKAVNNQVRSEYIYGGIACRQILYGYGCKPLKVTQNDKKQYSKIKMYSKKLCINSFACRCP